MEKIIIWKTQRRKVKDLIPATYNPRKISEKERQDLIESIQEFNEVEPVVINTNNHLIGGHQRIGIYADLNISEIDVRVPSRKLTLEEEMRLNLRLNKNTGSWDEEKLADLNIDMLLDVGFGDEELANLWDNVETTEDGFNPSKAIEEAMNTKVKNGEIYQLGDHRLMCGDSLDPKQVQKLMAKELAGMIYCDPPYNIGLNYGDGISTRGKYKGTTRKDSKGRFPDLKYKGIKYNDSKNDLDYKKFIEQTILNARAVGKKDLHFFYWCDENFIWVMQEIYKENQIAPRRVCLWIKNNFNMTPQFAFNKVYEPCVYGTIGKPYLNKNYMNLNEVLNKEVESGNQVHDEIFDLFNIWLIRRDATQEYNHPTQKPVTLHEKALRRCTSPGTVILDLFGGSGSTLMACDQLKRKAYLMELDPIFCQVIINRWEKATGKEAVKCNDSFTSINSRKRTDDRTAKSKTIQNPESSDEGVELHSRELTEIQISGVPKKVPKRRTTKKIPRNDG